MQDGLGRLTEYDKSAYLQPKTRQRNQSGPRLQFKDVVKKNKVEIHQEVSLVVQSTGLSNMQNNHLIEEREQSSLSGTGSKR